MCEYFYFIILSNGKNSKEKAPKQTVRSNIQRSSKSISKANKTSAVRPSKAQQHRHNKNVNINKWSEVNMKLAIQEYLESNECASDRQIARAWSVSRATLKLRVLGKVNGHERKAVCNDTIEAEFVSLIKLMAQGGFPLGMKEVLVIAYKYAIQNGIKGFSGKKLAGYEWLNSFLKRHPELNVRKSEPLSIARASGMNHPVVDKWFSNLEASVDKLGIKNKPDDFWNVDETGLPDYFIPKKVLGGVGKPCYQTTATEGSCCI